MLPPIPRPNGMSSAAASLRYWERRQEIAANNMANVNTDGFKGERVFARLLNGAFPAADSATDMRAGTLRPTGAPLDLALDGDAFLVVNTPRGERLSRGGSFRLDGAGQLLDPSGNPLQGEGGPIVVPDGAELKIQADGRVLAGDKEVGRLRLESVPAGTRLQHDEGSLFVPAGNQPLAAGVAPVRQGFLEDSNVGAVGEMVDMISVQRSYASVQKAMVTMDEIRGTISRELGKPI
ncbi:MAG: flagellar hook-basal body complex protein [Gemmatimonadetes bacterium]|nr:flagellar hook-basal body complex protein [Gemmatimonadota bacterium]